MSESYHDVVKYNLHLFEIEEEVQPRNVWKISYRLSLTHKEAGRELGRKLALAMERYYGRGNFLFYCVVGCMGYVKFALGKFLKSGGKRLIKSDERKRVR